MFLLFVFGFLLILLCWFLVLCDVSFLLFTQMTEGDQRSMALLAKLLDIDEMLQVRYGYGSGYRDGSGNSSYETVTVAVTGR